MIKLARTIVAIGACAFAGACLPLSGGRIYTSLRVSGKIPGNTLLAENSHTCEVSSKTFTRVQIGDKHRCVWGPPRTVRRAVADPD